VAPDASFDALLREMTGKGLGFTAVVDADGRPGIFTDGDLRRLIERGADLRTLQAGEVMHRARARCAPTRWPSTPPT
jgi:arabinose-5-phosphate isomerase